MKTRILALVLPYLIVLTQPGRAEEGEHHERLDYENQDATGGHFLTTRINREDFDKLPQWNLKHPNAELIPPLKAYQIALRFLHSLHFIDPDLWIVDGIDLLSVRGDYQTGTCVWRVKFIAMQSGAAPTVDLLVAADGTLIAPVVEKQQPEQAAPEHPATRPESKSEGNQKPQSESEERSR
jgi:hypothetical protein